MLLWDGGLIKVEISRKGRKPCHNGPIQQIIMDEGELMSVGIDGCIRVSTREDNSPLACDFPLTDRRRCLSGVGFRHD